MNKKPVFGLMALMMVMALLAAQCPPPATPTPVPPTATLMQVPPTATPTQVPPAPTPTPIPPTPTPAPTPVLATSAKDILGTWFGLGAEGLYQRFNADGTFHTATSLEALTSNKPDVVSTFRFEGTQLILTEVSATGLPPCAAKTVTPTAVYVYHNTLYGNGWSGATWPGETGSLLVHPEALSRSTTVYLSNNIIRSTGEPYLAGESASLLSGDYRNCWYGDGGAPAWDTTALNDDPAFVNAGAFNFQLPATSPGIDAGKNVSTVVARDLLGVPRPQGLAFDLGAYELVTGTTAMTHTVSLPVVMR
jgi:hypothetical protein